MKVTRKMWADALRSGKYKQGERNLYNSEDNSYCCLGVARVLAGVDKDKLDGRSMTKLFPSCGYSGKALAHMNDKDGKYEKHTFRQIADIIEGKAKPKMIKG